MDPSLLTVSVFWQDGAPIAMGDFPGEVPDFPELSGHVLFGTSGSSGTPKWIALSKSALLASAAAVNRHLEVTQNSCWGLALPAHHVGGFGVAARAHQAGCRFAHFARRWDAPAFAAWLAQNQVTHTSLVPTQVHDLVAAAIQAPASLRAVVVGGGRLDTKSGRSACALGWPVLASYGMTEAASQIATQQLSSLDGSYHPEPIPLLPIWNAETVSGGRLRIAGPALFSGVLCQASGSWSFQARDGPWHDTSDLVLLDNRLLTPLGRADLRVKVLGELVDVEDIERQIASLSGGALAPGSFVVAALPDARTGHRLVPVFAAGTDPAVIETALSAYAARAPGFCRLHPALMLDPFPRSSLGKPRRAEITAAASSR
jgi:o-succinylbenzoate---CoA ligase